MTSASSPPTKAGAINFKYLGNENGEFAGEYSTYVKQFGDPKDSARTPLIVLHGGPGLVHDYLAPFSDLYTKFGTPIILYDQLGNGLSTHLKDMPSRFWKIDLFIDELVNIINTLGIKDSFALAGHSWGGILAAEFAIRRHPQGLKHLILTDSLASSALWNQSNAQLMQAFPIAVQEGLKSGMKDPHKFFAALKEFHAVHGCTIKPFPPEYLHTLEQVFGPDGDPTVAAAPVLNNWTIINELSRIQVPTFVINGRNDISQDFVVKPFFDGIAKVKWVTFEKSTHSPFFEERERYMGLINDFLN
ncbi:L-amino acid amidase [Termitomyces sp. J132]|nr:L-amino acid amidase [Termitomyces sp. J132]KNZ78857.1 L-amino acid amidase [Termitomyces sp. J132]